MTEHGQSNANLPPTPLQITGSISGFTGAHCVFYLFIKSLHLFVAISWLLSLLVCAILLLTNDKSSAQEQRQKFNRQIARIVRGICLCWGLPALFVTISAGLYMTISAGWLIMDWVVVKMVIASALVILFGLQLHAANAWFKAPERLPSRLLSLAIPFTLASAAALLYLAFAKPL